MRSRVVVLLSCLLVAGGAAGCGGSDVVGDVVPKSTPEIIPPALELADLPASDDPADTGASGATGATGTTGDDDAAASDDAAAVPDTGSGTAAPAATTQAPAAQAPATPAPTTPAPAPATGGAGTADDTPAAGGGAAPDANTGGATPGGLSDFCTQNPGACGQ